MKTLSSPFSFQNFSKYRTEIYGFSILWIMLFHSYAVYPPWAYWLLNYGNMGVELFLFIAGVSLYNALQKQPTIDHYLSRRLVRLLVPLYVTSIWEWLYLFFSRKIRFLQLVASLTMTNFWLTGETQAWFLSLLLVLYFLYPYIHFFIYGGHRSAVRRTSFLLFLDIGFLLLIYHLAPTYYDMVEIGITRIQMFVLGAALGRSVYDSRRIEKHSLLFLLLMLLQFGLGLYVLNHNYLSGIYRRLFYSIPAIGLLFPLSKLLELTDRTWFNKFLRFFGGMTIELYLIHLLGRRLLPLTGFYDSNNHLHYFLMLAGSILLAYAASKIDAWLINRLNRFVA